MIYTVTLNPSLDYTMEFDSVESGGLNRARAVQIAAGGKGINVSKVLTGLNVENTILGFVCGFTGDEIERSLSSEGCESEFIRLDRGLSRINVKVCSKDITELNAPGPEIPTKALEKLEKQLDRLGEGDFLVLAGNIPEGLPEFSYRMITSKMNTKGVRTIVDASGNALLSTLEFSPFLIKPNRQELGELFSAKITGRENIEKYAMELRSKGARNVLVSLDSDGALLAAENGEIIYRPAPEGHVINPVGAGDSMLAGFLWGYIETGDYAEALKCAVAAGSASAFSHGFASGDDIRALRRLL
ncbi:MAG: 1-phosphofructokinase [Lachnospiraceae bacterium]|nr:1-phosphofructokinase [Lachnospiraceae bacterium]